MSKREKELAIGGGEGPVERGGGSTYGTQVALCVVFHVAYLSGACHTSNSTTRGELQITGYITNRETLCVHSLDITYYHIQYCSVEDLFTR